MWPMITGGNVSRLRAAMGLVGLLGAVAERCPAFLNERRQLLPHLLGGVSSELLLEAAYVINPSAYFGKSRGIATARPPFG
jgi:hypothetical protein